MDKVKWKNEIWSLQKTLIDNRMVMNENLSQVSIVEMLKSNEKISGAKTARCIQLPELPLESCKLFAIPGPKSARTFSTPIPDSTCSPVSPRTPRSKSPQLPKKSSRSRNPSLVSPDPDSVSPVDVEDKKKRNLFRTTIRKVNSLLKSE